jgi:hypothetical protein
MIPELQKYYEDQFSLFIQPGWTDLIEDLQRIKDSINDLSLVTDTHDLYFRKGQLDILDLLLRRKHSCEEVYKQLEEEDETNV